MRTLPVARLAARASRVVKDVQGGDRITITVRGEPAAVMVPAAGFVEDATCKRCRYWSRFEVPANLGACACLKVGDEAMSTDMLTCDGEIVETGPDFGCIHFEEKDK